MILIFCLGIVDKKSPECFLLQSAPRHGDNYENATPCLECWDCVLYIFGMLRLWFLKAWNKNEFALCLVSLNDQSVYLAVKLGWNRGSKHQITRKRWVTWGRQRSLLVTINFFVNKRFNFWMTKMCAFLLSSFSLWIRCNIVSGCSFFSCLLCCFCVIKI